MRERPSGGVNIGSNFPNGVDRAPSPVEQARFERRLDATRDYATFSRESGRFGSHPSHDDYDD
jgi:hypothetical protein